MTVTCAAWKAGPVPGVSVTAVTSVTGAALSVVDAFADELRDARLDVGARVAGQHREARAFARRVA